MIEPRGYRNSFLKLKKVPDVRKLQVFLDFKCTLIGDDETRSGNVRYVQGIQPKVPARTMCRHGLYNSMVCARTSR